MRSLLPLGLALLAACSGGSVGSEAPDFALTDVNATSATYAQRVSPGDYSGQVSAWYFGWATCPLCQAHVVELDAIQDEVDAASPSVPVTILGINEVGREASNDVITDGVDMPWLQDTESENVFGAWPPARLRELKIVDADGIVVETLDLNTVDPREAGPRQDIVDALLSAAN